MIDHAVHSLSFQHPIIVDVPSAFFQRQDRSAPPDSKKPRQSLTGLFAVYAENRSPFHPGRGINDCLLPIESGAILVPWILALSTGSRRVRAVEHSNYRIDINFVISPALISSTGRLTWG
ncbi:hypothetical protein HFO33_02990 [Rhizobium leguminosarum]|uniref:hypothetical protein n=1 Tax=Rhizobium leguminosarum TaxID=384 RepID=UPI001C9786C5|nr:hypothetical protein [Rhizobium leguminosarum]MBY5715568.1 hypothetical protein [Rhizobium leguminosarum]